jgi:hypothetical protein
MTRKRRRDFVKCRSVRVVELSKDRDNGASQLRWPGEQSRYLVVSGVALIALCVVAIYWQTVRVPPLDYEDPVYLVHSPYIHENSAFSGLGSVWSEPYFANFHPVTTTTWLFDSVFADERGNFDAVPFRIAHLLYYIIGACLLITLFRRLGIPTILAVLGSLLYAVHPIHTEVVAWLSARKDLVSLLLILVSFLAWLWARAAVTQNQWRLRHPIAILLVLLAVLAKPIAVIIPVLFVAYEFCSGAHDGLTNWRWTRRHSQPLVTRTLALTAIFLLTGAAATVVFDSFLARDQNARRLVDSCADWPFVGYGDNDSING